MWLKKKEIEWFYQMTAKEQDTVLKIYRVFEVSWFNAIAGVIIGVISVYAGEWLADYVGRWLIQPHNHVDLLGNPLTQSYSDFSIPDFPMKVDTSET